jgi:uncharacterized protein YlzI (FlbEa/FlbD family)
MLFEDDVILLDKNIGRGWAEVVIVVMYFRGKMFTLNRSKIEYMKCDFNTATQEEGESMLHKDEDINEDVSH